MSKKSSSKQEPVKPDIDIQTSTKMLSYTINIKEAEITQQAEYIKDLTLKMSQLEKEHAELKANYIQTFKTEKTIKQMQILLEQEQRNVERLKEELKIKSKEYKEEKDALIKKYESELSSLKNMMELHQKKMENVHNLQNLVEKQEEEIKQLTNQKENILKESENNIRKKDIKNQIKFSDLKKKMMQSIQETQKNVTELNIEYMDVSTKLTLLQNHQLLIEIQYQSEQIEDLLNKKEFLEKKVFELTKDLEVHKEVELSLAEKNKKYSEKIKSLQKNLSIQPINHINNLHSSNNFETSQDIYLHKPNKSGDSLKESFSAAKSLHINTNIKEFTIALSLEKKILKLENVLKKKQDEIKKMRDNYNIIEEKLRSYETKVGGFYYLLDEGLKILSEEELQNLKLVKANNTLNSEINFEKIKSGDVSHFTKEEKIFVIDVILKNLIPILDFSESKNNNESYEMSQYKSNNQILKKHLEDPVMKLVFSSSNNNMLYSVKRSLEKLPMINKNRIKKISSSQIF